MAGLFKTPSLRLRKERCFDIRLRNGGKASVNLPTLKGAEARAPGLTCELCRLRVLGGVLGIVRRDRPQLGDDWGQLFEEIVDFGVGVVNAEAEADRAARARRGQSHRDEHMRRIERAGGAGGATR